MMNLDRYDTMSLIPGAASDDHSARVEVSQTEPGGQFTVTVIETDWAIPKGGYWLQEVDVLNDDGTPKVLWTAVADSYDEAMADVANQVWNG